MLDLVCNSYIFLLAFKNVFSCHLQTHLNETCRLTIKFSRVQCTLPLYAHYNLVYYPVHAPLSWMDFELI